MLAMAVSSASAEPEYGRLQGGASFNNFVVGDKTAATIDFSNGIRGAIRLMKNGNCA